MLRSCTAAAWLSTGFQIAVGEPRQKDAMSVCNCVRVDPFNEPICFTSLKSFVYRSVWSAGGGSGRNCEPLFKTKGVTLPHPGSNAGALLILVHIPGIP